MKAEQEALTEEKNKFQEYKNKEKERLLEIQKKLQEKSEQPDKSKELEELREKVR